MNNSHDFADKHFTAISVFLIIVLTPIVIAINLLLLWVGIEVLKAIGAV